MYWHCVGKVYSIVGILLFAFSISPSGDFIGPKDTWFQRQRAWIKHYMRYGSKYKMTVKINPIYLFCSIFLGIIGVIFS
jgi:hypothetical protein